MFWIGLGLGGVVCCVAIATCVILWQTWWWDTVLDNFEEELREHRPELFADNSDKLTLTVEEEEALLRYIPHETLVFAHDDAAVLMSKRISLSELKPCLDLYDVLKKRSDARREDAEEAA